MVKGHHAYKDNWATNLSKEMPCQRDAGSRFDVSQKFLTCEEQRGVTCCVWANAKLKTPSKMKMSSKINTAFKILYLQKVSHSYICMYVLLKVDHTFRNVAGYWLTAVIY